MKTSESRLKELMQMSVDELMSTGLSEELSNNYPEAYLEKMKELDTPPVDNKRLAEAIHQNWTELMESGNSELLQKHAPEVYKLKYLEEFGNEPAQEIEHS